MKHPAPGAQARKSFTVTPGERLAVGIDVHKRSYHVALWSLERHRCIGSWVQPAENPLLVRKLTELPAAFSSIVYEAGPTGFSLVRALRGAGLPADVISPAHMPKVANEPKSDRRDARHLARLAAKDELRQIYVPTRAEELARTTKRHRDQCRKDHTCSQLRIKSFLLYHNLAEPAALKNWANAGIVQLIKMCDQMPEPQLALTLKLMIKHYEHTKRMLADADTRIRHLAKTVTYKDAVASVASIPGVGPRSAVQFLTEFGDLHRFSNRIEVARYLALAPEVRSSGESRIQAGLNPAGKRKLKKIIVEIAWDWVRYDDNARTLYGRMMQNTGCPQKAIVAVARKLGLLMWHLARTGQRYDPSRLQRSPATAH